MLANRPYYDNMPSAKNGLLSNMQKKRTSCALAGQKVCFTFLYGAKMAAVRQYFYG
jgi:hypothetical protein